jgi:L,D-transpeptidase YcbB
MTLKLASAAAVVCIFFGSAMPSSALDVQSPFGIVTTVEAELQSQINSLSELMVRPVERTALQTFYANRGNRPVWVDRSGPTRAASQILAELAKAAEWGLNGADYTLRANKVPMVSGLMTKGQWSAAETAAAEFEISALILKYARDAQGGRITDPDRMLSSYLDRHPQLSEPGVVLAGIASSAAPDSALRSLHPKHDQFQKLHDLFVKLQGASNGVTKVEMPEKGPLLVPGATHDDVALLRKRLGVDAADGDDDVYDKALVQAVKAFQASADLDDDGLVGAATRKALNGTGDDHLAAIRANMEQWRWMPEDLGQTHLFVNVPAFSIELVENGETVLEERVIVGKHATETPIFSKQLTAIVLKPSWILPDSIKLEKLLSSQRSGTSIEDEGYLIKKGSHVIDSGDVDWNTADLKDYAIYQPSGDGNALGDVKFLFPNKHSVYLHDTPNKALFDASARLFSHGCVRLRHPLALAQRLLDADKGDGVWNVKKFVRNGEDNTQIMLDTPLPIHVAYFTVWIGKDGVPQYLGDPYGHEERVTQALNQQWAAIDKGVDHLAKVDTQQLKSVSVQPEAKQSERIATRPSRSAPRAPNDDDQPAPVRRAKNFEPPSGLTNANAGGHKPKFFKLTRSRSNGGVGEMMRASLQH